MKTRRIATVFGGSGFIGRYVVKRLAATGAIVRVAVRDPESALFLKPMGDVGQVVPLYAPTGQEADVARAVAGADLVVNATGLLNEGRPGDFMRAHRDGPERIARLAAAAGVSGLVHVSAIGADANAPSLYARSKAAGETAVRAAFPAAAILRPSIVFGPEDDFFNRFAGMAAILPVVPIVHGGTRFQPVYVGDVADAVRAARPGETYELGGPDVKTFREIIDYILFITARHRMVMDLPPSLASIKAAFLERLPGKLLTRDQVRLLARDNVMAADALGLASLGLRATPLDLVVPQYLSRFHVGGMRKALAS